MKKNEMPRGLYGITCPADGIGTVESVRMMIDRGAGIVQYRDKVADPDAFRSNAEKLKSICDRNGVVFFVNDRVEIARELGAHLHIGNEDGKPCEIRGNGFQNGLGYSIDGVDRFEEYISSGECGFVDYLGVYPIFPSTTKCCTPPLGLPALGGIIRESPVPVFALGGINEQNVDGVLALEPAGVAIGTYKFDNPKLVEYITRHYG
jgi:thiamine-phosphate diphosphorylase